jgi:excisionase family DNA binding protein
LEIMPGPDGLLTRQQAAALCGVDADTISQWIRRGHLQVARRQGRSPLLDPVEVAKAEHATAKRARRLIRTAA